MSEKLSFFFNDVLNTSIGHKDWIVALIKLFWNPELLLYVKPHACLAISINTQCNIFYEVKFLPQIIISFI